jgi:hypothetical protein
MTYFSVRGKYYISATQNLQRQRHDIKDFSVTDADRQQPTLEAGVRSSLVPSQLL